MPLASARTLRDHGQRGGFPSRSPQVRYPHALRSDHFRWASPWEFGFLSSADLRCSLRRWVVGGISLAGAPTDAGAFIAHRRRHARSGSAPPLATRLLRVRPTDRHHNDLGFGGIFLMFLLERAFHGHAHHSADGSHSGHAHDHSHDHAHAGPRQPLVQPWAWCGAFAGLAAHSLADGAALAASVGADAEHGGGWLAGFATFLAVVLHKPFDSGIIATLMINSGASSGSRWWVNAVYAMVVPLGAILFLGSLRLFGGDHGGVLGVALALAAGVSLHRGCRSSTGGGVSQPRPPAPHCDTCPRYRYRVGYHGHRTIISCACRPRGSRPLNWIMFPQSLEAAFPRRVPWPHAPFALRPARLQ